MQPINSTEFTEQFLPDRDEKALGNKKFTLVLDMDETLIHFRSEEKKFKLRPSCLWFLNEMSKLYEVVIFTAGSKQYADYILNFIEKRLNEIYNQDYYGEEGKKFIDHRLYRHHC